MFKKFLCFEIILCFLILTFCGTIYASESILDLNATSVNPNLIDRTTIHSNILNTNDISDVVNNTQNTTTDYSEPETTTSITNYEDEGELSISNILNIILIAIGVVLILLGIALIIKLK